MNWVVVLGAVLFAMVALSMIAPAAVHDPFSTATVIVIGIFVGMMFENATSSDHSSENKRRRKRR